MPTLDEIMSVMEAYAENVREGLDERWDKLPVELYDSETYETIGGLLARQATLSIELALTPMMWTGHIAPLVLRCMTDCHITLAWILNDPAERSKKYILYGLGQEKLQIEHLKADGNQDDERIPAMIEMKESWLGSQRRDFLTEVNVGNWAGLDTRKMAQEADCEGLYKFAYVPFSGAAHNMWQHISMYNLKMCSNPLHKYHRVPTIREVDPEPDFVYRSAKYLNRSYRAVDDKFGVECSTTLPLDFWLNAIAKIQDASVGPEPEGKADADD
jgi:hypothetical protein